MQNQILANLTLIAITSAIATGSYHLFNNGFIFFGFFLATIGLVSLKITIRDQV